jgi:hypothetical protein
MRSEADLFTAATAIRPRQSRRHAEDAGDFDFEQPKLHSAGC